MKKILSTLCLFLVSLCVIGQTTEKAKQLEGKRVSVLGDSYVANHRRPYQEAWHFRWADSHGMIYQNVGRNGGCVAYDRSREGFGPSLLVRYKQIDPQADYVIIIAGHNDAGFIEDSSTELAAFTDSLKLLIKNIRVHCPKAQVLYVTPWYVDRAGFEPTVKAIRKVCRKMHVPLLDNYSPRSIIQVRDAAFRHQYFQGDNDTAHLNAAGHELFLPTAEAFFKKHIKVAK